MREALETWYGVGAMKEFRGQGESFACQCPKAVGFQVWVWHTEVWQAWSYAEQAKPQSGLMELGLMARLRDCTKNIYIVFYGYLKGV